ncbi:MAG: hypothetical protein LC689_03975 [Myxococcales bacterium]|nr:hypothetical protein [Myxococcales bacterium]
MAHNLTVDELLALLKDESLKPDSIAEEMECAGVPRPQPAQVQAARDALVKLDDAGGIAALPEMLALALVHAAGREKKSDLLLQLALRPEKTLAKESKRELQKLKQKGVAVQEIRPQGEAVLKPLPEAEAPPCYASSIDAYGERAVWWARPARQGVEVVQVVISDVKGILAADALGLSRRSYREFVKRLPRTNVVTTAEIPKDHARQLIAEAESAGVRNGFAPPESYAQALRMLGPAPETPPPSPGLALELGDDALAHQLAGAALFDDPLFVSWIPEEDALRSFALKVDEIGVSQLYIDAAQRRQAFERAAEEAALAYFTPPRRSLYARRLVEMAHVLAGAGRIDAAKTALAVSRVLPDEATNPFCRALFSHALQDRLEKEKPPPEPRAGSLITP